MGNTVQFGLRNVHFAALKRDETGEMVYDTPSPLLGAVELSLEPVGDPTQFYADDRLFFSRSNNAGYEGTLSISQITEKFRVDVLGEISDDTDHVLTENVHAQGNNFALMFEFQGDVKATRHVIWNCTANRPTVTGATKTDATEITPNELTFVASGRASDGNVKTQTKPTTPAAIYDGWFDAVYEKSTTTTTA